MLDKGGARIREREKALDSSVDAFMKKLEKKRPGREKVIRKFEEDQAKKKAKKVPRVRVRVEETHDGEACECITKEMTVEIGQTIELEHVCHDGRRDVVKATVLSIE